MPSMQRNMHKRRIIKNQNRVNMKKLEMKQMEIIVAGADKIEWFCAGLGVVGIVTGFFTLGTSTALAMGMGGSFCTGYFVAGATSGGGGGRSHGAGGSW
jgi:predicted phage tail protein